MLARTLPPALDRRTRPAGDGPAASSRLAGVDVLRGFGMFVVVGGAELAVAVCDLVPRHGLRALSENLGEHVEWEGLHFHDWIFPLLVFVTGLTIPMVVTARLDRGVARRDVLVRAARRVAVLFLAGLAFNGALQLPGWDQTRVLGVLQRYALAWGGAAVIVSFVRGWRRQLAVAAALLVGYWLLILTVAAPGYGAGDLTPAGNLLGSIDRLLLQPGQLFEEWGDPEGIVSTVAAIGSALLGAVVGGWLRDRASASPDGRLEDPVLARLALAGGALVLIGYGWGRWFPLIKQLWTSSFVVVTVGWGMVALAACLWLTEHRRLPRLTRFFEVFGRNALLIYVASVVVDFLAVAGFFVGGVTTRLAEGGQEPLSVVVAIAAAVGAKWLLLWFLDRHDVHLRA